MTAGQEALAPAAQPRRRRAVVARALEENGVLVAVVAAFAAVLLVSLRNGMVGDGWLALVAGREVAQHGLPHHDTLTVWAHGRSWIDQQWLGQLVLYALDRLGGLRLVLLAHAALAVGGLGIAAAAARRLGASARSVGWICIPALAAYWIGADFVRPQSFAYPLFAATFWLVVSDRAAPSRRVFLVVPGLALWANLHGSVLLGAALVNGYVAAELAGRRMRPARGALLALASWLAVIASPYALSLPTYYRTIFFGRNFGALITEWGPTTLGVGTAAVFVLILGGLWLAGRGWAGVAGFPALVFAAASVLALDAVRNAVWLALTAVVVLPAALDAARPRVEELPRVNRRLAVVALLGAAVAAVAVAAKPDGWFERAFPVAVADAAASAAGPHGRVFANERYADWLLWTHPELAGRIAFDGRLELLTADQLARVPAFRSRQAGWTSTLRGYRVAVLYRADESAVETALRRAGIMRTIVARSGVTVLARP